MSLSDSIRVINETIPLRNFSHDENTEIKAIDEQCFSKELEKLSNNDRKILIIGIERAEHTHFFVVDIYKNNKGEIQTFTIDSCENQTKGGQYLDYGQRQAQHPIIKNKYIIKSEKKDLQNSSDECRVFSLDNAKYLSQIEPEKLYEDLDECKKTSPRDSQHSSDIHKISIDQLPTIGLIKVLKNAQSKTFFARHVFDLARKKHLARKEIGTGLVRETKLVNNRALDRKYKDKYRFVLSKTSRDVKEYIEKKGHKDISRNFLDTLFDITQHSPDTKQRLASKYTEIEGGKFRLFGAPKRRIKLLTNHLDKIESKSPEVK